MLLAPHVWPSGGDLAARSRPIVEEPPGRFSTTTDCPRSSVNRGERMRNTTSVEPPGAYGTMMRTTRVGKFCAAAGHATSAPSSGSVQRTTVEQVMLISSILCPAVSDEL